MKCVFCGSVDSRVIDSRALKNGDIRRRRECDKCHMRFSSYETVENNPIVITNASGIRECFKYEKLLESVVYCNYCRGLSLDDCDDLAKEIERRLLSKRQQDMTTAEIVAVASESISEVDEVAAFVYHIQHNDIASLLDVKRFF